MAEFDARNYDHVQAMLKTVEEMLNISERPEIGIICGSGLGKMADLIEVHSRLPYSKVPNLPSAKVVGHKGEIIYGRLRGKWVVCFNGRYHSYEHQMDLALCSLNVRIMHHLGAKLLLASSAAGGINPTFEICDLMLIKDHIFVPGLAGLSPLTGLTTQFGPRFVSLHDAYDSQLRELALEVAKKEEVRVHEGIYVMSGGPQYESPTEVRLYSLAGADALGMSICHETVVALQLNMKVLAFCLITNVLKTNVEQAVEITHEEVLAMGVEASDRASRFLGSFIEQVNIDK